VAGRSIQAVCRQNLCKRVPNSISSGGALKVGNGCVIKAQQSYAAL
jgi:hypothetical protein